MGENSEISWTDHTFNPWIGCTKVSAGCLNCYAETQDKMRFSMTMQGCSKESPIPHWGKGVPRQRTSNGNWKKPLQWDRKSLSEWDAARGNGLPLSQPRRPRVFCASLADWLDDEVPIEWLADLLDLIRRTPNLDWLLLTKRPENWNGRISDARSYLSGHAPNTEWISWVASWGDNVAIPPNVWIGTTVENQAMADKRIPELLSIPAKVRFLSCEPLLEAVDLMYPKSLFPNGPQYCCNGHECGCMGYPMDPPMIYGIHWVIAGGESGPGFRPFDPDWARSLRDQCKAAGVAFHMKQMGGLKPTMMPPIPADLMIREFPITTP